MTYRIAPFPMTLSDRQGHSTVKVIRLLQAFQMRFFVQLYGSQLT